MFGLRKVPVLEPNVDNAGKQSNMVKHGACLNVQLHQKLNHKNVHDVEILYLMFPELIRLFAK